MAGAAKKKVTKSPTDKPRARVKGGVKAKTEPHSVDAAKVLALLQGARNACAPAGEITTDDSLFLAVHAMATMEMTPGLYSAYIRLVLDARKQLHVEALASKGIHAGPIWIGPQTPPPGATDPPECPQ